MDGAAGEHARTHVPAETPHSVDDQCSGALPGGRERRDGAGDSASRDDHVHVVEDWNLSGGFYNLLLRMCWCGARRHQCERYSRHASDACCSHDAPFCIRAEIQDVEGIRAQDCCMMAAVKRALGPFAQVMAVTIVVAFHCSGSIAASHTTKNARMFSHSEFLLIVARQRRQARMAV